MENITLTAVSAVFLSAAACIIDMLTSGTGMEKTVRYILGLIVICTLVMPVITNVSGIKYEFDDNDFEYVPEKEFEDMQKNEIQKRIELLIDEKLRSEGIYTNNISVETEVNDENEITSIRADVRLSERKEETLLKAKNIINEDLGIECNVS